MWRWVWDVRNVHVWVWRCEECMCGCGDVRSVEVGVEM